VALLLQLLGASEEAWLHGLHRGLPDLDIRIWPNVGRREDILYAAVARLPDGALADLPNLRVICSLLAGQDSLLGDPRLPDVPVVRTDTEAGSSSITETVVMHVLRHYRRLPEYALQQARGEWSRISLPERVDTVVGFLGLGLLGLAAAEAVRGFGFKVCGWARRPRAIEGVEVFHGAAGLPAMLSRTNILVNVLPLTPETEGVLDRAALGVMPRGSALINIARGAHLPADALYWALDEGILSSATLDVFEPEPPPPSERVWSDPRITLTPHVARSHIDLDSPIARIVDTIRADREGKPLISIVDRSAGY
jgi:glyoxylate/hydroxypyruvate reductase A